MKKNWISLLALTLSIIACIITWLRVEIYTTNDTFVGIMAGFIGACATILIGIQIYNSIDTRNSINKLNDSFNIKIKELDKNYDNRMRDINVLNNELSYELNQIKKELKQAKEERALSEKKIDISITKARAIAFCSLQPFSSYANFYNCLTSFLKMDDPKGTANILKNMKALIKVIESDIKKDKPIKTALIEKVKKLDYNSLKKYPLATLIENEYTECHKKLMELIDKIEAKQ